MYNSNVCYVATCGVHVHVYHLYLKLADDSQNICDVSLQSPQPYGLTLQCGLICRLLHSILKHLEVPNHLCVLLLELEKHTHKLWNETDWFNWYKNVF